MHVPFKILTVLLVVAVEGCAKHEDGVLEGQPGGPYRLSLTLEPPQPEAGVDTILNFQLAYAQSGQPVQDLQIAHERLIHNFIVNLDFSSFAHIHHEDFYPVSERDRAAATLRFPYRFPTVGRYRVVSEFAHRNRSWTKRFDITVGNPKATADRPLDTARTRQVGAYTASLRVSPETPVAGFETELVLVIERNGSPVNNLGLFLGSELHGAAWRDDGRYFGHVHSYTPKVAAILELAKERGGDPATRGARVQEMLVQLMCLQSELVFPGPEVPMRYVFPEPGRYHLFLQAAPGGKPKVFRFALDVATVGDETDVAALALPATKWPSGTEP